MAQQSQPAAAAAPIARQGATRRTPKNSSDGFVLLNNDNVLRGNAIQRGNEIVITRGDGTELLMNRARVRCWANSLEDLYRFRIANRRAQDLNAFVTDIRWSIRNGLTDPNLLQHAKSDLKHASKLAPGQPTLRRLAQEILRQEAYVLAATNASKQPTATSQSNGTHPLSRNPANENPPKEVAQVDYQQAEDRQTQEIDQHTLATFTRDVQPMLLNRCGGCHGLLSQRDWKLLVPTKGSRSSARMTRENYLALSKYLNFDDGLESELRLRAMDGHAGKRSSLGLRETVSSKAFDRWLQHAKRPGSALDIAKRELASVERPSIETQKEAPGAMNQQNASQGAATTDNARAAIERLPQVNNPFDPEIFNRRQQLR